MESIITDLKSNVSFVRSELTHITKDFSSVKPGQNKFNEIVQLVKNGLLVTFYVNI